jgi:hypothetical protein
MHTRWVWRIHMWLASPLIGPAEWYLFVAIATHVGFKNDFGTYVDPGTVQRPIAFGIDSDPPTVRMVLGV